MSERDLFKYTGQNEDEITITHLEDDTIHFMLCKHGDVSGIAVSPYIFNILRATLASDLLLKTVDLAWGYAMEDGSIPATSTAHKVVDMVLRGASYIPDHGTSREKVYRVIDGERDYQDARWEDSPHEGKHTMAEYLRLMRNYQVLAMDRVIKGEPAALDDVRKIGALAVACMEQHGAPPRA